MKLKLYTLSIALICLMLISCGGGGGGGALVAPTPVVTTPTYTYETMDATFDRAGTFSTVYGRVLSQRWVSSENGYWFNSGATTTASVNVTSPDENGDQTVKFSFTKNWSADSNLPDINYDFTISNNNYYETFRDGELFYSIDYSPANADITTVAFWNDEDNEFLEGTEYVNQSIHLTDLYGSSGFDQIAFVFGDPTKSGDMPSTGSANYNVVSQAWLRGDENTEDGYLPTEYYLQGDGVFTANFSARTIIGDIDYGYVAKAYDPTSRYIGSFINDLKFDGTISGVTFSGDVIWGNEDFGAEGWFNGGFFGPDGNEIGGVFNMKKIADKGDNSSFWQATGAFTGCVTC